MSIADAHHLATAEFGGEEHEHFGKAAYRIAPRKPGGKAGRIFMTLWIEEGSAVLMLDQELQAAALDLSPAFEPYPGRWGAHGATVARLDRLDARTFRQALGMAHRHARR